MSDNLPVVNRQVEDLSKKSKAELLDIARQNHLKIPDKYLRGPKRELADFITKFLQAVTTQQAGGATQMPAQGIQPRAGFDIRVIELPKATATEATDDSVLHGVADSDKKDYQYPFSQLKTYFQSGIVAGVSSVFGRTGAVVAANGDYDLGELGDVTLGSLSSNQVLLYNGSGWVNSTIPTSAISVDLGYTAASDKGTVTNNAGDDATIPVVDGTNAGLMTPTQKGKLDGISSGADVNVPTNLGNTPAADSVTVTSSTGSDTVIAAANTTSAGVMTKDQVTKLNGIDAGADVNVPTNLSYTAATNKGTVNSSTGSNADIPVVGSNAGLMTPTQKSKLDGIASGAQVNVPTNLSYSASTTKGTVNSSTGSNADIPLAVNNGNAGLFSGADKKKLDGIADGAGQFVGTNLSNSRNATTVTVSSSTGNDTALASASRTQAGVMAAGDKDKLDGIATGAQVNVATNITCDPSTNSVGINSSTGGDGILLEATGTRAGCMTQSHYTKLYALPVIEAGTSEGQRLRWNNSAKKWQPTDLFY